MTKTLHVAPNFTLPLEIATHKNAIVAMSGAGKSNTAVVLAEELYAADIPWVAIDPKGDWYGVRSSGDGKGPGLPVPVFGGLHGDVPLEPRAGRVIAKLIADERLTCVLDVSEFDTRQDMWQFLADLANGLLKLNRDPIHLFLDEADDYIPQRPGEKGQLPRCKGEWSRVIRRGRFRGLGTCIITQRSAVIDKDVLTQTDNLFAMRVTSPNDQKPIAEWVKAKGLETGLVESLAELEDGETWLWSPQRLKRIERMQLRRRRTFDAGETPKLGTARKAPARLADIDLGAIETQMRETIEKAKAEDPRELRKRIAALDRELKETARKLEQRPPDTKEVEVRVAVPTVPEGLDASLVDVQKTLQRVASDLSLLGDELGSIRTHVKNVEMRAGSAATARPAPAPQPSRPLARPSTSRRTERVQAPGDVSISKPQQKILDALVWWEAAGEFAPTKQSAGWAAGYSVGKNVGGYFGNTLGAMRTAGLIDYPSGGTVALTDSGRELANPPDTPLTTHELQQLILSKLKGPQRRIVEVLLEVYPEALTKQECGARAGYSVGENVGGYFGNTLGSLRSLGLIDYPERGHVAATDVLFLEGR